MKIATVDYETYYDKEYSLSKMSTEDYVNDPRFEVIGVSVKLGGEPGVFHSGDMKSTREFLFDHRIHEHAMVAQNTMFDQLINQVYFNIHPPVLFDTMHMAQAILKPFLRSISLASTLKHLQLGVQKGTYVANMIGRRRESLSSQELRDYGAYCVTDTEGEYALFKHLLPLIPREELDIIDMTLRMYLYPQLKLDTSLLERIYENEVKAKADLLARVPPDVQRADLMSNQKFAALLQGLGIDPPVKISPTTGKDTWAFAKNDPEWKDLCEEYEDHPIVAPILEARVGVKSTIQETRCARLLDISQKYKKFRVPLKYYAAHTGRYGGFQKINVQNFPRVNDKLGHRDQIRYAVKAPKHHVVLASDLSQIEARMNAWLSDCRVLVNLFRDNADVYSKFASLLYGRTITKETHPFPERFVGKTCILGLGYGMGSKKLRVTLRKDDIKVTPSESHAYVNTYRQAYPQVPDLWQYCDEALEIMAHGGKRRIGPCTAEHNAIVMPNGMRIVYHNLRYVEKPKYRGWIYDFGGRPRTIWGGKVVENIIQGLSRIKIMNDMVAVRKELSLVPVLQAHDELVYTVLERDAEEYQAAIEEIMLRQPDFAPDLPLGVESAFGPTYGDAK